MAKSKTGKKPSAAKRLARYRARAARRGLARMEVAVPKADMPHMRRFARAFRKGGDTAERLRRQGDLIERPQARIAKTGKEFMEMSRRIIGEGIELELPPRDEYYPDEDAPTFGA